jgi:shikimate dehydrogenase
MSGAVPLAGVVGWPVGHSRSPALHRHWLSRYGIRGHYVPLTVAPEALAVVLAIMPRMGFRGANVTLPHKEVALALASETTERACAIGAANTIVFLPGGGFRADNTDGSGFLSNLRQAHPAWDAAAGPALVLGAGGASRAIVAALLDAGASEVRLANRTCGRAVALADAFGPRVRVVAWEDAGAAMTGAATIVNTTSLGMTGQPPLDFGFEWAEPGALVTDIVYQPLVTPFLARAAEAGLITVDGLGMLLHQAAPGFEAWFGRRPEVDEALRQAVLAADPG